MASRNNTQSAGRTDAPWIDKNGGGPLASTLSGSPFSANSAGTGTTDVSGWRTLYVEVQETAGGTISVQFQGSIDGQNWHVAGYQEIDAIAAPARAVAAFAITANLKPVFQILDLYPLLRLVLTSNASASITVYYYGLPV